MRAWAKGPVRSAAAGLLLGAATWLATVPPTIAEDASAPAVGQGAVDYSDYQQGLRHFYAEQYELALPYFVRAREEAAAQAGVGSSEHATALNNLGEVYRQLERYDDAELLFREALAIDEARLGPDHQGLAKPLNNLALVQRARGDHLEAEHNLKRSLRILEDSLGRRHPDVAGSLNNLARLYESTGHPERAAPLLERALLIARDTLGEAHPTTRRVAANLERVSATLAAAAPDEAAAAVGATATAAPLPPPSSLVLPPAADVPARAPAPAAAAVAAPTFDTGMPEPPIPAVRPSLLEFAVASSGDLAPGDPALGGADVADPVAQLFFADAATLIAALDSPATGPAAESTEAVRPSADGVAPEASSAESVARELLAAAPLPAPRPTAAATVATIEPAAGPSAVNDGPPAETARPLPQARPDGPHWQERQAGAWAMHLASVRNPSAASEEWQRLAELLNVPAAVRQLEPQRIETAEQGVFYRVLGGPFATSAEAAAACGPIRAQGEYCGVLAHDD